jgi:DNA (cytosine-5)-methyltransferase 1
MKPKTAISLFSGAIDGLSIAFEMANIRVTHHVEYDTFCCANLRRLHPESTVIEGDIRQLKELPYADVIFGGPPCQGFSLAGDRNGFADERYLWPEMYRLIQVVRPQCVLVENVRGAASGDNLIDAILCDLESIGYTGGAFLIPACLFGAPHERYRVFIVAYTERFGHEGARTIPQYSSNTKRDTAAHQQGRNAKPNANLSSRSILGNTHAKRLQREWRFRSESASARRFKRQSKRSDRHTWRTRSYESRLGRTFDGRTYWLVKLGFPGFPAGQGVYQHAFEPARTIAEKRPYHKERIQALGNAIVWQQAYPFAQAIATYLVQV